MTDDHGSINSLITPISYTACILLASASRVNNVQIQLRRAMTPLSRSEGMAVATALRVLALPDL